MGIDKNGVVLKDINLNEDLELLLAWRSHPDIYKWFYEQDKPLIWEKHYSFWNKKRDRQDWVIQYNNRRVGSVSAVSLSSASPDVGIYIGEITLWGQGVGELALKEALNWLLSYSYKQAQARIFKTNVASQRLFEKCGFIYSDRWSENRDWLLYKASF